MADKTGYIGRAPSDSAVTVARQSFSPTGVTTDFTFAAGYTPGYFDLFINGVKMIEGSDYTSSDGSTFAVLNGGAQNGDVLEGVAYKAFNAVNVSNANANFTVGGDLAVSGNLNVTGIATLGAGTSVSFATTAYALEGTPNITVGNITASSGDLTVRNITGVAATFTGVVTYEDVTNVDSVGIVTARTGVRITDGGLIVTAGIATLGAGLTMGDNDKAFFGDGGDLQIYHTGSSTYIENQTGTLYVLSDTFEVKGSNGNETHLKTVDNGAVELYHDSSKKLETTTDGVVITGIATATGVDATGIVTATSFEGSGANLTNLPASGDSNDITACLFI